MHAGLAEWTIVFLCELRVLCVSFYPVNVKPADFL
jgi:hypothetical protein